MNAPMTGTILEESTDGTNRIGIVEFEGKRRSIYLNLVPGVHAGDHVRFQAGFATERADSTPESESGPSGMENDWEADIPDLQAYSLLRDLDPDQLRKLLPMAMEQRFDAGQVIFRLGERSEYLHLIVRGEVALEDDKNERPIPFQTVRAGEVLGWSALTRNAQTHFQARAITFVSTIAFDGAEMRAACDRDPAMGYAVMSRLLETVTERLDALRAGMALSPAASAPPQVRR